jgi:hypothetical protein
VAPNTGYRIHRSALPYFIPAPINQIDTLSGPFDEIVNYPDAESGAGTANGNRFYAVVGATPGGQGAASNTIGEFGFTLTPGG